ncbi:MAG: hypothetical protein ACR2LJ_09830 [Acidimicrobiales bacterium]
MTLYPVLYDGLNAGWLSPADLSPDLAGIQVWVRFAEPCCLHPGGGCHDVAVHEFTVDSDTSCIYAHCDPDGAVPETTTDIVGVRFLWSDGRAEPIGPAQSPYLHPILARLQPS